MRKALGDPEELHVFPIQMKTCPSAEVRRVGAEIYCDVPNVT